ncbi:hypothetical protein [Rhizobium johnstonii]|uniref:hypothetical protein n=1 Tax=Rhizobium johnstonii TaxID=3019933 RepID=UPI003F9B875A
MTELAAERQGIETALWSSCHKPDCRLMDVCLPTKQVDDVDRSGDIFEQLWILDCSNLRSVEPACSHGLC